MHFAVLWPTALSCLIRAGATVDVQDKYGRRPIQLAVAMGAIESVRMLIEADCSLATSYSHYSLLQESLLIKDVQIRHKISTLIVQGLINRHTRLLNIAMAVLPPSSKLAKSIVPGKLHQSLIPNITREILCLGREIPPSLKLDDKGPYDTASLTAEIRLPIPTAEQLWQGGFQEVEISYDVECPALTPILGAWFNADFDMLRWLISKGASPFSRHPLTGGSGLHWYAHRLGFAGLYFNLSISQVFFDRAQISQLMWDNSAWRDSCSCLRSIGGCQPVTIFLKQKFLYAGPPGSPNFGKVLHFLREFWAKIPPPPGQVLTQLEAALRFFAFKETHVRHVASCCYLQHHGDPLSKPVRSPRWRQADVSDDDPGFLRDKEVIQAKMQDYRQKLRCCGCPVPDNLVCVVFRGVCPIANRRRVNSRRSIRPGRSMSI